MIYTIAADHKCETIANDGRRMGRSRCVRSDAFDLQTGIRIALLNIYLTVPEKQSWPMEGYPHYYIVDVPANYIAEMIALGVYHLRFQSRQEIVQIWGKTLAFKILSYTHSYAAMQEDLKQLKGYSEKRDRLYLIQ